MRKYIIFFTISVLCFQSSCTLGLKGISIDYESTKTFFVRNFENRAGNAPPTLSQQFTERLKDKIRNESRLAFKSNGDADIEFFGAINDYQVSAEAQQTGVTTAINRLTIVVEVNFVNNKDPKKNWKNTFSFFSNFSSSKNLLDVQDALIREINNQLVEDIFNKAFTDW